MDVDNPRDLGTAATQGLAESELKLARQALARRQTQGAARFRIPAGIDRPALARELTSELDQLLGKVLRAAERAEATQRDGLLSRAGILRADVLQAQHGAGAAVFSNQPEVLTGEILQMIELHLQLSRILTEARTSGRMAWAARSVRYPAPDEHVPPPRVAGDDSAVQGAVNEWWEEYRRGVVKPLNGLLKAESVLNYKILRGQDKAKEVLWAALRHLVDNVPDIKRGTLAKLLGIDEKTVASWLLRPPAGAPVGVGAEGVPPPRVAGDDSAVQGAVNEWWEEYRRGVVKPLNGLLKAESVLNYKILRGQDKANEVLWAALRHLVDNVPDIKRGTLAKLLGIDEKTVASWLLRPPAGAAVGVGAEGVPPPRVGEDDSAVQGAVDEWWEEYRRGVVKPLNGLLKAESVLNYKILRGQDKANEVLWAALRHLVDNVPDIKRGTLADLLGIDRTTVAKWLLRPPAGAAVGVGAEGVPPPRVGEDDSAVQGAVNEWWETSGGRSTGGAR